jgi:hypothetical protein
MAEDNVKKIRDLNDFTSVNPMTTGDHLVVASSAGAPATNKATIKDVVNLYLASSATESEGLPETVTDENGDEVPNPLKGATTVTEMVDTDGDGNPDTEVEVVNTPITSKNIDTLVDPGSGLEVKTVCQDEDYNIVDCSDLSVKYKTKKLALATSAESKTIIIRVNNAGEEYRTGIPLAAGQVTTKFKRLRDAFSYIRNDIGASDTIVRIYIENDIDEGEINHTNATYFSDPNAEINKCYIYIYGDGYSAGAQPPKIKFKTVNNPGTDNAYVPMWLTGNSVLFQFVHFVIDLDDNRGVHSAIRSHNICKLSFIGCKISARGGCHNFIEASRGATVEISNYIDNLSELDPLNKDFWAPAMEFDFGPRKSAATGGSAEIGDDFYCDYFFGGDTGAVFRFPEYGPHIPWSSDFNTTFQSRIHFSSDKIRAAGAFLLTQSNCTVDIIALFTASTGLTFTIANFPYFLRAAAFNSINLRNGTHMKGTVSGGTAELANSFPGNALANPTTQFGGTSTAGQDYIMTNNISPTLSLLSTYKGESAGVPSSGNLTNYWDNVDWASI